MINSLNQSPAFGSRCKISLNKRNNLSDVVKHLKKVAPEYDLKYVSRKTLNTRELAKDEFTITQYFNLNDGSMLKEIHFKDNNNSYYKLMAMLNSISKDFEKPFKVIGLG